MRRPTGAGRGAHGRDRPSGTVHDWAEGCGERCGTSTERVDAAPDRSEGGWRVALPMDPATTLPCVWYASLQAKQRGASTVGERLVCMQWPVDHGGCSYANGAMIGPVLQQLAMDRIGAWGRLWEIADLAAKVRIRISPHMRRSLGRWIPARGDIRLSTVALTGAALLDEVLCHEAAHAAVHLRYGPSCRPHGPEWQALMRVAGFEPRTHIPVAAESATPRRTPSAPVYEHRCPVCHSVHRARRPIRRLRCAACRAAGLDGALEITKREAE